jgi:enamine deaminase RidA (YjgF/YER057c/UK114 family)
VGCAQNTGEPNLLYQQIPDRLTGGEIDGAVYISGQGGEDAAGRISSDFDPDVRQLKGAAEFQRMNAVYKSYFKDPRPARTTVVLAGLLGPGNLEITATARK